MKYRSLLAAIVMAGTFFMLSSCASAHREDSDKAILEGTTVAATKVKGVDGEYTWQLVKVPATIRGGVMIPEHDEYVLIKAGQKPAMPYMIPTALTEHGKEVLGKKTVVASENSLSQIPVTPSAPSAPKAAAPDSQPSGQVDPPSSGQMAADARQVITKSKASQKGPGTLGDVFPTAVFNGKTKDLVLDREISYHEMDELAQKIRDRLNIFVDIADQTLAFSDMKDITYETGFFTEELAKDLKGVLNNSDSRAVVNKTAGLITVYDDPKGQAAIAREVQARKDQYAQYEYLLILKQGSKIISTAEGEVSQSFPARFADGGITLEFRGRQGIAKVSFSKYPDIMTGFIDREGGDLTATRDDFKLEAKFHKK